jgi:hypothetical protein
MVFSSIVGKYSPFDMNSLLLHLLAVHKKHGVSDRSSIQDSGGYASLNQQKDDLHDVSAPQKLLSTTPMIVDAFIYVCRILDMGEVVSPKVKNSGVRSFFQK